jgi:cephalosporin-C deacetylase
MVPAMATHFDLPLEELRTYRPVLTEPTDLRAFWKATLDEAAAHALDATFTPHESPLRTVDVLDVRFSGYAGQRVAAWLLLPKQRSAPLPCVVQYVGYGGGRGLPHEWLTWSAMGFAHLVMDTRGQGSDHHPGVTPDLDPLGAPPHVPGFLTLGLPDPARHYYRRVFTDAVRAVDAAAAHPDVDAGRIVTAGGSQGGALSLAASILRGWLLDAPVRAALADVPFLCHFRRAAELAAEEPYTELVEWCRNHRDQAETAFAVECRHPRRGLPALNRLRRAQPLPRSRRHARLGVERARGRRGVPGARAGGLAAAVAMTPAGSAARTA